MLAKQTHMLNNVGLFWWLVGFFGGGGVFLASEVAGLQSL